MTAQVFSREGHRALRVLEKQRRACLLERVHEANAGDQPELDTDGVPLATVDQQSAPLEQLFDAARGRNAVAQFLNAAHKVEAYWNFGDGAGSVSRETPKAMASSLLRQMTQKLKSQQSGLAKKRLEHKKEEEILFSGVGSLAGAGAGAFIDTKGQNGGPHKLFAKADGTGGVPTNLVAGAAIGVAAIAIKGFPMKAPAAATGLSLLGVGLYRYIVDKHAANAASGG